MFFTRLKVTTSADFAEIIMAEVAEAGFDTFMENDSGFEAYGEEAKTNHELLESIKQKYAHVQPLLFFLDKVRKQNWNKEWEKNVEPVMVGDQCLVRASFHHIKKKYPYEIIITPKMSFGTGHHQTTWLMLKNQLEMDHKDKLVMDVGCGTAVLSVMASKRGAKKVEAFDPDEWSVTNGKENAQVNRCGNIRIRQGKIANFSWNYSFDIILANINKNVLLEEMKSYATNLKPGGQLLLSGFFIHDTADLIYKAGRFKLQLQRKEEKDDWASILLIKGD